jgi:hypothetical protein
VPSRELILLKMPPQALVCIRIGLRALHDVQIDSVQSKRGTHDAVKCILDDLDETKMLPLWRSGQRSQMTGGPWLLLLVDVTGMEAELGRQIVCGLPP